MSHIFRFIREREALSEKSSQTAIDIRLSIDAITWYLTAADPVRLIESIRLIKTL